MDTKINWNKKNQELRRIHQFKISTCLDSCSSQSLYRVKNFLAKVTLSIKPQLASFTRMMICLSGTIIATVRNWILRFSGSSWRPAYPGFIVKKIPGMKAKSGSYLVRRTIWIPKQRCILYFSKPVKKSHFKINYFQRHLTEMYDYDNKE